MPVCSGWRIFLLAACGMLAGCGLTQTMTDGTVSMTKSIFYKKIKVLHLDFVPRAAANADGSQTPMATMVRVYQLKEKQALEAADYPSLLRDGEQVLKEDLLVSRSVLVMPNGHVSLNVPMDEEVKYVAVVALFNQPDLVNNRWRLVLTRNDLDPDYPRVIALGDGSLSLLPVRE
ncbi:type VI secretion system lipoprotein TssJ [Erwinia sp.]|uniref:type VI secretion system lipoprotein TssJ n=1 Tax=Erwinia citreus TaxID=558 RepID=UPI003C72A4BA